MNNEYFKLMRLKKGLTQEQVSKVLGYKTKQNVSNWERGTCMPPLSSLKKLKKLLKLDQYTIEQIFVIETLRELRKRMK